jgi:sulfate adenylyltransferase large subunit
MNVRARLPEPQAPVRVQRQEGGGLLRFVACGSVDHGKSTLIGRLLYESQQLLDDQVDALAADSRKYGTQGEALDFALLVDGLAAEREQNITIDVAYRFFATERRKFIVIDAPGHEQYTANMATGASLADLALVLVGANEGLTPQTKRHLLILSLLGIRSIVLAVNKMDRAGWSQTVFAAIEARFRELASGLGIDDIVAIPLAAKSGDNVVTLSSRMPWYRGPTLLEHLERVEPAAAAERRAFRMPVQWVGRPNADFRGYSGLIVSGEVRPGMPVRIFPSGRVSRVARIPTFDGDLDRAEAGRSVTLTLADQIDVSRGDLVTGIDDAPTATDRITARLFWMGGTAAEPGRRYLFKLATATASAQIEPNISVFDPDNWSASAAPRLNQNEIGSAALKLDRAVAVDRYADCKDTGSFILIDPESYDTVGMGCVETVATPQAAPAKTAADNSAAAKPIRAAAGGFARWTETHSRSLAKAVSWRATGSLDTFLIAFLVTGSPKVAGSVAGTEIITKIVIYYLHERIWAWVPWGKRSTAQPQIPAQS